MWASRELSTPSDRAIRSADHDTSRLPDRQLGFGGARPRFRSHRTHHASCAKRRRMVWDGTDLNYSSRVCTVLLTQWVVRFAERLSRFVSINTQRHVFSRRGRKAARTADSRRKGEPHEEPEGLATTAGCGR